MIKNCYYWPITLKLEDSDFVGKTKGLIVKNIKKEIDVRLETTEEEDSLAFLMEVRSKLVESSDKQDTDEVPEDMKSDEKANKEELEKAQSDLLEMQKKFKEMIEEQEKAIKIAQEKLELTKKKVEIIPNTNVSRLKDFKIKEQIGQPNQLDTLSYISLLSQINAGVEKGYCEKEICFAVVNSICGDLTIRKYLETIMKDLTLTKLKQHLRAYFKQKNSTELYQELINMSQKPDEDAQNFLMRALTIRQSILVNADDDMG